jgi:hypothetical protein
MHSDAHAVLPTLFARVMHLRISELRDILSGWSRWDGFVGTRPRVYHYIVPGGTGWHRIQRVCAMSSWFASFRRHFFSKYVYPYNS